MLVTFCLFALASLGEMQRVRAQPMDLALSRLSTGACDATTGGGPLRLADAAGPTLQADQAAWRELATQLAYAIAPVHAEPVIMSGPRGFDLSLETHVAALDDGSATWARGSRGGSSAVPTCDGRNEGVRPVLVSERLRVQKGLPLGFSLGATFGKLFATSLYLVGADVKFALLEEVWGGLVPDLAVRFALSKSVGANDYTLLASALDVVLSKRFVVARTATLAPFAGIGATFTRARTDTIDLTPNIDASACRDGVDPVCNGGGIGASAADLAHDVRFSDLTLYRYRGMLGVSVGYRGFALSAAATGDLLAPRLGDRGTGARGMRQWGVHVAPTVSF